MTIVTGKLLTIGGTVPGPASFVKFQLKGYEPDIPRVIGTNLIVDAIEFDAYPDNTGAISISIQGNDTISPLQTFYHISIFQGGILYVEFDTSITGASVNLNALIATGGCILPPSSGNPVPCLIDLSFFFSGTPGANEAIGVYLFTQPTQFPVNLAGSQAIVGVAPTLETVFTILKNGIAFGYITFLATQLIGVFTSIPESFSIGDILAIVGPAVPDSTIANISVTIQGVQ